MNVFYKLRYCLVDQIQQTSPRWWMNTWAEWRKIKSWTPWLSSGKQICWEKTKKNIPLFDKYIIFNNLVCEKRVYLRGCAFFLNSRQHLWGVTCSRLALQTSAEENVRNSPTSLIEMHRNSWLTQFVQLWHFHTCLISQCNQQHINIEGNYSNWFKDNFVCVKIYSENIFRSHSLTSSFRKIRYKCVLMLLLLLW